MKLPPLTTKAIRTYVKSLPPDESCGAVGSKHRCVVARYLQANLEGRNLVEVQAFDIRVYRFNEEHDVIDRATVRPTVRLARFISRFDDLMINGPLPADVLPLLKGL